MGLEGLGGRSDNFAEIQNRMQTELLNNPDMLRQLLDNPFVQRLMSDPENMRTLITRNPQMQELMERNPEINHMLNNPDLLRQTMELARNPSMLQELMRSHDRAISNLESIPGGYNALQRMYRDIQEPMLTATTEQFSRNPFAGLIDNNVSGNNPQQGTENREPLPNPWAGQRPNNTNSNATTNTNNLLTSSIGGGTARPPRGTGTTPPLLNPSSLSSLMQNVTGNSDLMQNMLSAPYTQSLIEALAADPTMANNLIADNPLLSGDPALQEQMRSMMPQLMQQLQSSEVQNVMSNPQALNAIMQIQQGMQTLRQTAPSLVDTFGSLPGGGRTTNAAAPTTNTTTTTSGSDGNPPAAAPRTNPTSNDQFSEVFIFF